MQSSYSPVTGDQAVTLGNWDLLTLQLDPSPIHVSGRSKVGGGRDVQPPNFCDLAGVKGPLEKANLSTFLSSPLSRELSEKVDFPLATPRKAKH